jgi:class 3 adenylate cyclase
MFMDDTIPIMLKYDITIDKFLGDGVLGFANDPIQHADYVKRVADAALEIRKRIRSRADLYSILWGSELEIRVGIAEGSANVGFYGSRQAFRSYTALGPVMSLASRLCGAALPGQVLVSEEVQQALRGTGLGTRRAGHGRLKGFDSNHFLYELFPSDSSQEDTEDPTVLRAA